MSFILQTPAVDLGTTAIENIFINDFMPTANGTHVKVYMMAYNFANNPNIPMGYDNQKLAKHLNISLEDVNDAWTFWEKKGIITKSSNASDALGYDIQFLSLRQLYLDNNYKLSTPSESRQGSSSTETTSIDLLEASRSLEVRQMFAECETFMQRNLFPNERKEILDYIYEFGVSPDFVVRAFEYAVEKRGIRKVKYVIAILKNWRDEGILRLEDLDEQMKSNQERIHLYRQIYQAMGYGNRQVSSGDRQIIDKWFDGDGLNIDFIQANITEASTKTANLHMRYVDGYIQRRLQNGIKTTEDLKKELETVAETKEKSPSPKRQNSAKPNKFNDFNNNKPTYSNTELEILLGIRKK